MMPIRFTEWTILSWALTLLLAVVIGIVVGGALWMAWQLIT